MRENETINEIESDSSYKERKKSGKSSRGRRVARNIGFAVLAVLLALLVVNAFLCIFMPHYYPTFGKYRLFAIVTDSMQDTIPRGNMIVTRVPDSEADIQVGDVITYEVENDNGELILITHRVIDVGTNPENGKPSYTTKGDNAPSADSVHPDFDDVVGVFTGKQCGFFGYFFGFLQSTQGAITLILVLFIVVVAWIVIAYVDARERRRNLAVAALKKSRRHLSEVNLRYDNIDEITAVMDVISMVTADPRKRGEEKEIADWLNSFIDAETLELLQISETAAVLDSLPAPDIPLMLPASTAVEQPHSRISEDNPNSEPIIIYSGSTNDTATGENASRSAYAQYREIAAQIELKQTAQLSELLDNAQAISPDDRARIDEYKAALKKDKKDKKPRKPLTPEQIAARKAAAERRKAEQEAFLNSLAPDERELYLSEQKLSKARNATIRRLKRLNADRKILEQLNDNE